MREAGYAFAVFGSSPFALLLAGLLADRHRRRVCVVCQPYSAWRLPQGFDLSTAPLTRPSTWALLKSVTPESVKLISRIAGKATIERLDPVFVAETPSGRDVLGHMRHLALGFGLAAELQPPTGTLPPGSSAIRIRDAVFLNRAVLEPALLKWLAELGVVRVNALEAAAEFTVLADDTAVLEHGSRLLQPHNRASIATTPGPALPSPFVTFLDRGLSLYQNADRAVSAIGRGAVDDVLGQTGGVLGGEARRTGQAAFVGALTADGAPMLGLSSPDTFTIAGLGVIGAFLAPTIARFLAGEASQAEADWIDAHSPLADRSLVAEFAS